MKNLTNILTASLALVATACAHAADFKTQNNTMIHGRRSSTADKLIEIDTNDGASNPKLKIVNSDKNWHATTNKLKVGDAAASDKTLEMDIGSGANNPKIKWDNAASKLRFSNDGTSFSDIGTGSGGSSSGVINLLSSSNAGFEDGTTSWTASGGTFTTTGTAPFFGAASGTWDSNASAQTLTSQAITVIEGLKSKKCQLAIAYEFTGTTGDYVLEAWDGSTALASFDMVAGSGVHEIRPQFTCPSSGTVAVRIRSTIANPALIKLDGIAQNAGLIQLGAILPPPSDKSRLYAQGGNGFGSTRTSIRRWDSVTITGDDFTGADSATNGYELTIKTAGKYFINWQPRSDSAGVDMCLTKNQVGDFTGACNSMVDKSVWIMESTGTGTAGDGTAPMTGIFPLAAGDVLRFFYDGTDSSIDEHQKLTIQKED